jgi:pre-mRNA-processing factor 17
MPLTNNTCVLAAVPPAAAPAQIKYVADPSMHSMPSITPHPNGQYLIAQSLDNQVLTYSVKEGRFKQNRKKTFKGHNTAGYACQVAFSPDARFVLSGGWPPLVWLQHPWHPHMHPRVPHM